VFLEAAVTQVVQKDCLDSAHLSRAFRGSHPMRCEEAADSAVGRSYEDLLMDGA
jgi:hypothetical protein